MVLGVPEFAMEEMNLLRQARGGGGGHPMVVGMAGSSTSSVRDISEEIDLEIGPGDDDDPGFHHHHHHPHHHHPSSLVPSGSDEHYHHHPAHEYEQDPSDPQQRQLAPADPSEDPKQQLLQSMPPCKKKKVVKKWRDEWADTYKWAYVAILEGSHRIFCSVCKEFGRKHRRNPYGNEGSRNMQLSALEEHNSSLLHKEALRLQIASKDKSATAVSVDRPAAVFLKAPLSKSAESILESVTRRDPHELEYIQAIQEFVHSLEPVLSKHPQYVHVLERMLEPERVIMFRVAWVDDKGETQINRGFRIQFNQALGPYRGGIRFHPSVYLGVMKLIGLEETLRNALAAFGLGGAGGGSDFDTKGKSDNEIMRFCQSFMEQLYQYLGPTKDYPCEDLGVGQREMGYLFGQYRHLTSRHEGAFSGPKSFWSGSSLRTEATGYCLVHFVKIMLEGFNKDLRGLRCVVSGSGKIALTVVEKLMAVAAIPVTISDTRGYLYDEEGFDYVKMGHIRQIKSQQKSLRDYVKNYPRAKYCEDMKPWGEPCDVAFACASQNEVNYSDAVSLLNTGCSFLVEGSTMPCTAEALEVLRKSKIILAPSKAASAGAVAMMGLDANQGFNDIEEYGERLQGFMKVIYDKCLKAASDYGIGRTNPEALVHGANIASFLEVAQAMLEQGVV